MRVIATKTLSQPVQSNLVACCPTMDLVAVVGADQRVDVYRFNGQRVFGLAPDGEDSRVESICWKYNGQYLAVSWSNNSLDVVSAETGNALQHLQQFTNVAGENEDEGTESNQVRCIGWGLNLIDTDAVKSRIGGRRSQKSWESGLSALRGVSGFKSKLKLDDFMDRIPDLKAINIPVDLPDMLAQLDVTDLMPKLPTLPMLPMQAYKGNQHPASEIFSSQASLDAALHRGVSKEVTGLNSFLLSESSGNIRLIFYDSLGIGNVSIPEQWTSSPIKYLSHATHLYLRGHLLLGEVEGGSKGGSENSTSKVALISLSFRFLRAAGKYIHNIDYKAAQLETLVYYVGDSLLAIQHHWKQANDLPSRFRKSIGMALEEKKEPSLVECLYHLAATGHCFPSVKEWLVDQLTERGHKRWDHSVLQGYTKIIELTQENFLPAIDRCNVILSSLKGLAQYHEHNPIFDVPVSLFSAILDIIRCMRLLAHHILMYASEEQRQFVAFSKWLRHAIEVQAADPTSQSGQETIEQDVEIDYKLLFQYIQRTLETSNLEPFIQDTSRVPGSSRDVIHYEDVLQELEGSKSNIDFNSESLRLSDHFDIWKRHNDTLMKSIASWQRANTVVNSGLVLHDGAVRNCDIRIVHEGLGRTDTLTSYVLLTPNEPSNELRIYRITHEDMIDTIAKDVKRLEGVRIQFAQCIIEDVKFVDDENLLVLLKRHEYHYLLALTFSPLARGFEKAMSYSEILSVLQPVLPAGEPPKIHALWQIQDLRTIESKTKHVFDAKDAFIPKHIEVNGRKSRQYCVVVSSDRKQLKILDLSLLGRGNTGAHESDDDADEDEVMTDA